MFPFRTKGGQAYAHYTRLWSLSSEFLSSINPLQVPPVLFLVTLWELKLREPVEENVGTRATAVALSKKSFVSDPGVSYLLPASMKLRQINLLV